MRMDKVILGSALFVLSCILLHLVVTVPGDRALQMTQQAYRKAQQEALQNRAVLDSDAQAKSRLLRLLSNFQVARNQALWETTELVQSAAKAQELRATKASYELAPAASGVLVRYAISLPLKGTYPALRAFLRQLQRESPSLVIENVSIGRPGKGDAVVEAQLELAAYFRKSE